MKVGSLFTGAGGLDLAVRQVFPDVEIAWHAEIDPATSRVLAHHWPNTPNLGDITAVDWATVEPVDILTGGFPCQDVSAAGRRAGLAEGTRSGLWSHMAAAIAALRPDLVLIENVRGLLSARAHRPMEPGSNDLGDNNTQPVLRALGAVLGDLADLGFDAEWCGVRASDVGAAHRRERVFVLAYPADAEGGRPQGGDEITRGAAACGGGKRDAAGGAGGGVAPDADGPGPQGPGEPADPRAVEALGQRHAARRDSPDHVALLPTPQAVDGIRGDTARSGARSEELLLPGVAKAYAEDRLMPTPRASDGAKGGPNQRGSSGDLMLPSAAIRWGNYAAAIRRQESLTRPAPPPTEPSPLWRRMIRQRRAGRDRRPVGMRGSLAVQWRLLAEFSEWLMMWPAGWVTDPAIGLSRQEQLRCIGNGVCPPQGAYALRHLLSRVPRPATVPSECGEQYVLPIGADS